MLHKMNQILALRVQCQGQRKKSVGTVQLQQLVWVELNTELIHPGRVSAMATPRIDSVALCTSFSAVNFTRAINYANISA